MARNYSTTFRYSSEVRDAIDRLELIMPGSSFADKIEYIVYGAPKIIENSEQRLRDLDKMIEDKKKYLKELNEKLICLQNITRKFDEIENLCDTFLKTWPADQ